MKALVGAFNQEKEVGAFSVIVELHRLFVYSTNKYPLERGDGSAADDPARAGAADRRAAAGEQRVQAEDRQPRAVPRGGDDEEAGEYSTV